MLMTMNRIFIHVLLLFILCSLHAIAQTDFYYYKGTKIPLTRNEEKICVSISKEYGEAIERIRANVEILCVVGDKALECLLIPRSDYEKLTTLDFWEEDAKNVILTSCYFTEHGDEVVSTPYLNVRLKKEQDTDLLTSYVENYKLKNLGNSSLMPMWYTLCVTPETGKSPLQCANELWESGDFAVSAPDLADLDSLIDEMDISSVAAVIGYDGKSNKTGTFDLQGRRLSRELDKGIYIKDGRKYVR